MKPRSGDGPAMDAAARPASKRAEQLAGKIEREIMRARWPIGELIGTEPELIERYGVSRGIFREAVRILEHHRVVKMRSGPGGGLVVSAPDATALIRAAMLYLDYEDVSVSNLLEARLSLELHAVERTVQKLDEAGVDRLRAALQAEETSTEPGHHSHDVHRVLAEMSGNPALALFIDVLVNLTEWRMGGAGGADHGAGDREAKVKESKQAHRAIVESIVAGDLALALHRTRRHIEAVHDYLVDAGPSVPRPAGGGAAAGRAHDQAEPPGIG
ncbi:FadR/GntR family transcriptional regulator [Actinomadura livida]|uniref:DNA-binding FadR family transcriptional regulator n=2 Tax=Actinomadura livida TaxID=79909 RepID=A0A7W7ICS2_9ACTN|nr:MULTISPECIES: FCD domain-containing protein [Actinomadura]MBB4774717.1 DNA-binding FadR family transcriptional regulator [Actinomadura catellatispora]